MLKKRFNISNRLLYTLITIGILAIIGVGVYAVAPNPGHSISQIDAPSGCSANQVLQWTGSSWTCANGGNGSSQWVTSGNNIYYSNGNVGIGGTPTNPPAKLRVNGTIYSTDDITTVGTFATWEDLRIGVGTTTGHFIEMLGPSRVAHITFPSNVLLNDSWEVWNTFGPVVLRSGGLLLNTQGYLYPKPTCDNAHRGMIWFTNCGPGQRDRDRIEICSRHLGQGADPFNPESCNLFNSITEFGWVGLNYACG